MLLTIIDRKLKYYDRQLIKIDTYSVKASQYNHFDETYKEKNYQSVGIILMELRFKEICIQHFL